MKYSYNIFIFIIIIIFIFIIILIFILFPFKKLQTGFQNYSIQWSPDLIFIKNL